MAPRRFWNSDQFVDAFPHPEFWYTCHTPKVLTQRVDRSCTLLLFGRTLDHTGSNASCLGLDHRESTRTAGLQNCNSQEICTGKRDIRTEIAVPTRNSASWALASTPRRRGRLLLRQTSPGLLGAGWSRTADAPPRVPGPRHAGRRTPEWSAITSPAAPSGHPRPRCDHGAGVRRPPGRHVIPAMRLFVCAGWLTGGQAWGGLY